MRLRNAVTSAKKINPLQILKDVKSPGSSYISSAKKALAEEQIYNETDRIHFEISGNKDHPIKEFTDKENIRDNHNILVERFDGDPIEKTAKDFINSKKFQLMEQDYNELASPEKSHHKHSKSRSRTKEKRGNRSEEGLENFEILPAEGFENEEDKTCMAIDFNISPEPTRKNETEEADDNSQSIEWIIANNIVKKKDMKFEKLGEEESRNIQNDNLGTNSQEKKQEIEVEEIKRVKFGNQLINNINIGANPKEESGESNLGQYIDCLESVESSANKSVKADAEKELLRDRDNTTEYMTDEILSMMLFNDIHDCPMHPIRENNFVDYFKDKYPFNRELGIDTSSVGTNKYIDDF